jgi:hypothetical protein
MENHKESLPIIFEHCHFTNISKSQRFQQKTTSNRWPDGYQPGFSNLQASDSSIGFVHEHWIAALAYPEHWTAA